MTNKEQYKRAFSVLRVSGPLSLEVEAMKTTAKRKRFRTTVAAAAACFLLVCSATAAYAADLGGIQRTIQIWTQGDQTAATITFDGTGSYQMEYTGPDGQAHSQGGGGVAIGPGGVERPLTEQELMEELNSPEVTYQDDGSVWIYWYDQALDITDRFQNGVCYVQLTCGAESLYVTVVEGQGYSASSHRYPAP